MFTGLIREIAQVDSFIGEKLVIRSNYKANIGDSIAINGACLTVTKVLDYGFEVELSHESRSVLAVENYKSQVHIEPAMRLSDRVEGHIVQGHVDAIGEVIKIDQRGTSIDLYIKLDTEFMKFMIPKGSVTVDGISLTINEVFINSFRLTIIPHSLENTLIKNYQVGTRVNIETDLFARYIYHMFKKDQKRDDNNNFNIALHY